jgi:hypothetical protein
LRSARREGRCRWVSWSDWLEMDFLPFEKARAYAQSLNLRRYAQLRLETVVRSAATHS